ncbi:hypothetical protein AZE42_08774 [Rhizopogon vesiculosus]|uniref:Uncharacterized protein n=1 Tax=Rhizopogon vesiculosus TaxID=180088 RepID=A0A1J8RC73_9AGAM|nr:hypothetical protein AZE42_08774 [Rhizopogon vesiculosus]
MIVRSLLLFDQGAGETGSRLSEKELERALEFCSKCFNPTSPEHLAFTTAKQDLPGDILDATGPLIDPQVIESVISKIEHTNSKGDQQFFGSAEDLELLLDQINSQRVVHREYTINNFEVEERVSRIDAHEHHVEG